MFHSPFNAVLYGVCDRPYVPNGRSFLRATAGLIILIPNKWWMDAGRSWCWSGLLRQKCMEDALLRMKTKDQDVLL